MKGRRWKVLRRNKAYGAREVFEPAEAEELVALYGERKTMLPPAEAVYRADLGFDPSIKRASQHPNNVWSLHGLHECLQRLGKTEQASLLEVPLDMALARTDVPVKASCFCRRHQ